MTKRTYAFFIYMKLDLLLAGKTYKYKSKLICMVKKE
jgi:hypothetical protein